MKNRTIFRVLAVTAVSAFVACTAPDITGSEPRTTDVDASRLLGFGGSTPSLLECPSSETFSATSLISIAGGVVSAGGVTIAIPANALLSDALVTVTVPPSRFLEVDISVEGSEHFEFQLPVVVTMSYARCSRSNIDLRPLSAWYIDSSTKALLEQMPSVDDKLLRTVTFTTDHLSGYAIAN
jgi:hypothetical protein